MPVFPALALGGGCTAFILRLLQWRTGFEPDTGLPVPGTPFGVLTAALVLLAMVACILLRKSCRRKRAYASLPGGLLHRRGRPSDPGGGRRILMAVSGLADLAAGMGVQALPGMVQSASVSQREQLLLGL